MRINVRCLRCLPSGEKLGKKFAKKQGKKFAKIAQRLFYSSVLYVCIISIF